MKRSNYSRLYFPKRQFSRTVEELMGMKPITMNGRCGTRGLDDLKKLCGGVSNLRAVCELLKHHAPAASAISSKDYIKRLRVTV